MELYCENSGYHRLKPLSQFPADLVTFAKEILNGKLHYLCSYLPKKLHHRCLREKNKIK